MTRWLLTVFKFLLLEHDDPSRVRDFDAHAIETLGLADQLQDILVKVHVELLIQGMADDESGLKPRLGLVNALLPRLVPEVLKGHQCLGDYN